MFFCRDLAFCRLSGIDEVEDEDADDEGAEGVEQYIAEAHRWRGRLTHRRRALGVSSSSGSMSRPAKRQAAAVGRWELFGWVRHVPVSSCGSDDDVLPLIVPSYNPLACRNILARFAPIVRAWYQEHI